MSENSVQKCRTCLKNSSTTYPVTELARIRNSKATYGQLLKECAKLELSPNYERLMPQYLCVLCCRDLRNAYNFIQQAQYCHNKLINVITKQLPNFQEKTNVMSKNGSTLQKALNIKLEKDIDDFSINDTTTNEFRIVNTNVLLKAEVLDEYTENGEPIQYYVEDKEEVEIKKNDQYKSDDLTLEYSKKSNSNTSNTTLTSNFENVSHTGIDAVCPICKKKVSKNSNLITHIRIQHDIKTPRKFLNIQNTIQRKAICDYKSRCYATSNFHKRSKHGTEKDKFKCKFCSYMSSRKFNLLTHMKKSHMELIKILKVDPENKLNQRETINSTSANATCLTEFPTTHEENNALIENKNDSSNDDIIPLTQKLIKSQAASAFNNQLDFNKEQLNDEMFARNILDIKNRPRYTFDSKSLPRRCNECGNIYKNYGSLRTHQRSMHAGEIKYCLCPHCGKKLKNKMNLKNHIQNVHGPPKDRTKVAKRPTVPKEKNIMCTECSYVCSTITILKLHTSRRHTGEKPYKCDICFKSFLLKYDLKTHRYLHTGERPFKCSFCSKGFRCSSKLIKHKRIHNNERPFKCKDCDKSFTQSYNLTLHKRTHLKEKKLNWKLQMKLLLQLITY